MNTITRNTHKDGSRIARPCKDTNPTMRDVDLAYLAGFFDSRGSIFLKRYATAEGANYVLGVSIYEQDRSILEDIRQFFGAGKIYPSRQGFELRFSTREGYGVLRLLLPYLRLKNPQAGLGIKFQEQKTRERPLSDAQRAWRRQCYERMKALNSPE